MGNKSTSSNKNQGKEVDDDIDPNLYQQQQQPVQQQYVQQGGYQSNNFNLREKRVKGSSMNKQIYDDDEVLDLKELEQVKLGKQNGYQLSKGLSFALKPIQQAYKISSKQTNLIPAMLTLKTLDSTEEQKSDDVDLSGRPGIDLICIIDHSGSMSGQQIVLVRKTLEYLLSLLNEKDRLSLIEFDDSVNRLTGLLKVTKANDLTFKNAINSIEAAGGTNIDIGMQAAFQTIKERKVKNSVTSVFLLSDGLDGGAELKVAQSLIQAGIEDTFTIHTFGFGSDHDPKLMTEISQLKDGNFYFIQKLDKVDECFVDALGGLFSIVGQDVVLKIQANRVKPFTDHRIGKTYGPMWQHNTKTDEYTINISQLMSGISQQYIFEVSVPPCNFTVGDHERNTVLVKATLEGREVGDDSKPPVQIDADMTLTIFNQDEVIPPDSEIDEDVQFNILRVRGAEVLQDAINKAENKKYEEGQKYIDDFVSEVSKAKPTTQFRLNMMVNDLQEAQESCKPRVYEEVGSKRMMFAQKAHMEQRSKGVEEVDMYSNCVQMKMKSVARSNKQF